MQGCHQIVPWLKINRFVSTVITLSGMWNKDTVDPRLGWAQHQPQPLPSALLGGTGTLGLALLWEMSCRDICDQYFRPVLLLRNTQGSCSCDSSTHYDKAAPFSTFVYRPAIWSAGSLFSMMGFFKKVIRSENTIPDQVSGKKKKKTQHKQNQTKQSTQKKPPQTNKHTKTTTPTCPIWLNSAISSSRSKENCTGQH